MFYWNVAVITGSGSIVTISVAAINPTNQPTDPILRLTLVYLYDFMLFSRQLSVENVAAITGWCSIVTVSVAAIRWRVNVGLLFRYTSLSCQRSARHSRHSSHPNRKPDMYNIFIDHRVLLFSGLELCVLVTAYSLSFVWKRGLARKFAHGFYCH